ncbi:MAG: hypothetical protein KGJ58_02945 [Patescibacteria group bacterium]|nr:hypothetical protein [Patescibacteria group bacterium]MDE1988196.1 hypothetical protein [Patescibacteria group bacterium]MDE2218382.1 hypothetical protein [Patescibacteria group bacterium]
MSYLIKTGLVGENSNFDLQRREDERRKKQFEEHNEEEKKRKEEQAKKDDVILRSRIATKKKMLFLTREDIKKLEREVGEIDPKVRRLREEIGVLKRGSENDHLKVNAEKHKLAELKTKINEKKREKEKTEKIISDLEKVFNYLEKDIAQKEHTENIKGDLNFKERDEIRKEEEKKQLLRKISSLQQEERQTEQEISELERQAR